MPLSNEEITEIATRTADEVMGRVREREMIRDVIIGSAMGEGAIPLYGRETRTEPCSCCLIELEGANEPANRMCTTSGAIGTLKDREEREWCSEINLVPDGRCERARSIREAARECKEKYPEDTAKFFECFIPSFSRVTKGSNPGAQIPTKYLPCPICLDGKEKPRFREEGLRYHLREFHKRVDVDELVKLAKEIAGEGGSNPGDYVTITDPGKTTFKPGEIVSREAFERENERVKRLGEKPATGR